MIARAFQESRSGRGRDFFLPLLLACAFIVALVSCGHSPKQRVLMMATTTSVENSGLLSELVPAFERKYRVKVRYVAVGTGAAIRTARDGNADLIFVHDRTREEAFVNEGYAEKRCEVMKNYFTIVGPQKFQGDLKGKPLRELLKAVAARGLPFVSRGDHSGTHAKEKSLWQACGVTPYGPWYLETGSGMAATLRVADEKQAFALTDKATYLAHLKELQLVPYVNGEPALLNIYSILPVSSKKFPEANLDLANAFVRFVTQEEGRDIIRSFGTEQYGESLFQPMERP